MKKSTTMTTKVKPISATRKTADKTMELKNTHSRKPTNQLKNEKLLNTEMMVKEIFDKLGGKISLADIDRVLKMEQALTVEYLLNGYRVCKRDFLTLDPVEQPARVWTSPLNQKTYNIPKKTKICVRVGRGLNRLLKAAQ